MFNLQKLQITKYAKYLAIAEQVVMELVTLVMASEAQDPNAPLSLVIVIQSPKDPVPADAVQIPVTL